MDNKPKIIKVLNNDVSNNVRNNVSNNNDINKNILDEILSISSKILEKMNNLEERIERIEKKLDIKVDNELSLINLKELKKEDLNVNKDDVLKVLKYRDYRSILYIFKQVYKNKIDSEYAYPIKIIGKRSFEYYNNMRWNSDMYGYYCTNIICTNMQNLFTKYNNIDDIDSDDFIMNQQFIYKLSDEKYQKSIFRNIIEEVRINNL